MTSIARTLSIAAVTAFASLGAQAGELYGSHIEASFQSTRTRAEVQLEAAQAVTQFKNYVVVESNATPSTVDRATVQAEAVQAARLSQIAVGNRS
ncbi:MAG: DUF4148 domain-containing protein [Burkholderiaceae bacterium]|nr:DUF4148 domain-containing protein [Burkholderiaceae bacterium]NUN60417.1 DUF4148 domain-containing protein [Burkholderiaceae bacterium]